MPVIVPINYAHAGSKRAHDMLAPWPAQTAQQSLAVAVPPMLFSLNYPEQSGKPASDALDTVTTSRPVALVNPLLITMNQYPDKRGVTDGHAPMPTATTAPARFALAMPPFIAELHGTGKARPVVDPLLCVTASGNHHALITPAVFLAYYYGTMNASGMTDPAGTMTTLDRASLVSAPGELRVEDCTFRMLRSPEIKAAMAFPSSYVALRNHVAGGYVQAVFGHDRLPAAPRQIPYSVRPL